MAGWISAFARNCEFVFSTGGIGINRGCPAVMHHVRRHESDKDIRPTTCRDSQIGKRAPESLWNNPEAVWKIEVADGQVRIALVRNHQPASGFVADFNSSEIEIGADGNNPGLGLRRSIRWKNNRAREYHGSKPETQPRPTVSNRRIVHWSYLLRATSKQTRKYLSIRRFCFQFCKLDLAAEEAGEALFLLANYGLERESARII